MKFITLLLSVFITIAGCNTVENDCVCSEEFRTYTVTVTDTRGRPADSLKITIKNDDGYTLDVPQAPDLSGKGEYIVLDDSFTSMFCECGTPRKVFFSASDGVRTARGEFIFHTDECRCHVYKSAGPDTLVIR